MRLEAERAGDGVLVRVTWADIEPMNGEIDLSLIHEQVALIESYEKKI